MFFSCILYTTVIVHHSGSEIALIYIKDACMFLLRTLGVSMCLFFFMLCLNLPSGPPIVHWNCGNRAKRIKRIGNQHQTERETDFPNETISQQK